MALRCSRSSLTRLRSSCPSVKGKDVIPRHPHDAQQVGDIHVMERLGRLVVGEDASLVMGSVENPFQFCLAAPLVAGDKLPRNVGRQTILEEFQREADAFSIGGCHGLLACGCYWNSFRSHSTNVVVFAALVCRSLALNRQAHWPRSLSSRQPGVDLGPLDFAGRKTYDRRVECHRYRLGTEARPDRRAGSYCR